MRFLQPLVFLALLTPTMIVVTAAVISLFFSPSASPEPRPVVMVSSAGVYPAELTTDE